jgi:hypothetical protein
MLTLFRKRAAAYKLNDQVKAETSSLKEDGQLRKYWDTWTVTAVQQNSVSWKYKLKHDDGSAYDGGNWVAESKLRDP